MIIFLINKKLKMASLFSYQQGTVSAHQPAAQGQQRQPQPGAQPDKAENRGGFDGEFVERPPEVLQPECPVCLQIIRDPYQVTCCGYSFCRSCIERIKADNKPCPTCNIKGFSDFPNKGLKRSLYAFKVRCSHQKDGCEWTGELGQVDVHLNKYPPPEKRHDGCPLTTISCEYVHLGCAVKLPRKDMPEHLRENLLTHTSLLAISHANLVTENATLRKMNTDLENKQHFLETAVGSLQVNHALLQENYNQLSVSCSVLQAELDELKPNTVKERLPCKPSALSQLKSNVSVPRTSIPLAPSVILTMTDFKQHKRDGDHWYSPPVYTHHQGYKICLRVHANGLLSGAGTHVSVFVHFMRGEFDHSLKWPFRGVISFHLLDQLTSADHKVNSDTYDDSVEDKNCSRVIYGERAGVGWGPNKFIAHSRLEPKYLRNDTLRFQVCGGEVHV